MALIDKETIRKEIERKQRIARYQWRPQSEQLCQELLDWLDTLPEQQEVELENYISNKLRELGADLINHKPYSFNRGLNVGKTNAYHDILDRLNARKEDK